NRGDPRRLLEADLFGHIGPVLAPVPADPQVPVVGSGPEYLRVAGRFGQGGGAAVLGARDLRGDDSGVVPLLHGLEHVVPAAVPDLRVVGREEVRRVPVEPVSALAGAGLRLDRRPFPRPQVVPDHAAILTLGVDLVGVVLVHAAHVAVAAVDGDDVLV